MRPAPHSSYPRPGRCAALVQQVALAAMLGVAGTASACLPGLGTSCQDDSPVTLETAPTIADDDLDDALRRTFALYLVGGRGDTEIHLSAAGLDAAARTRPLGDGSHHCLISGLRAREAAADRTARLMLASRLIHEATHCQTSPYASGLRYGDAGSATADLLVALALESIADARAVLEIYRVDGADAARAAVDLTLAHRQGSASPAHATALALRQALALSLDRPHTLVTPEQTFAAALAIGQASALQTLPGLLERIGQAPAAADSLPVRAVAAALATAMAQARNAFERGRFNNRAATLHASDHVLSGRDHHFFVGADGSITRRGVVGSEGAHHAAEASDGAAADAAPQQRLALRWLRCQAALDAPALQRVSTSLANLIRNFSDGSPARTERVVALLDTSITACRRGQDLSEWLDSAADLLKAARAAG